MNTGPSDEHLSRKLPHDAVAERCLLSSILQRFEDCRYLISALEPGDFYFSENAKVFEAIQKLSAEYGTVDGVIVHELLDQDSSVPDDYVASLVDAGAGAFAPEYYCDQIREKRDLRRIIHTCMSLAEDCYGESDDSEMVLNKAHRMFSDLGLSLTLSPPVDIQTVLQGIFDELERHAHGEISGLQTGFRELDRMTYGLQPSQVIVIGGRPSMGKTSFAATIASNVASHQKVGCAWFSFETSREQLTKMMLCQLSRVSLWKLRSGHLSESEFERLRSAAEHLSDLPIFIQDSAVLSLAELHDQCRRLKAEHDLGVIFIDYLQLVEQAGVGRKRERKIARIMYGLKALARELDMPVVVLSQLNRAPDYREGNKPCISDLREVRAIEPHADVIMFLYRSSYYSQEDDSQAKVIVSKQRHGPTGEIYLMFSRECLRFADPTAEDIM